MGIALLREMERLGISLDNTELGVILTGSEERKLFDPYEKHHSTVKDACQLAEKLNVRNLLLYHTEDKNLAFKKRLYLEEGVQYYHGNLYIPDDLESFVL